MVVVVQTHTATLIDNILHFASRQHSCLHPGPDSTSTIINWTSFCFLFTSCHFSNPKQSLNGAIRLGNEQLQLIVVGINLIIEKWREKNWWNGIESSSCFQSKICCPLEGRVLSGRRGRRQDEEEEEVVANSTVP